MGPPSGSAAVPLLEVPPLVNGHSARGGQRVTGTILVLFFSQRSLPDHWPFGGTENVHFIYFLPSDFSSNPMNHTFSPT